MADGACLSLMARQMSGADLRAWESAGALLEGADRWQQQVMRMEPSGLLQGRLGRVMGWEVIKDRREDWILVPIRFTAEGPWSPLKG